MANGAQHDAEEQEEREYWKAVEGTWKETETVTEKPMSKTKRIEVLEQRVAELMGEVEKLKGVEEQVVRLTTLVLPLDIPTKDDMEWARRVLQ